MGEATNNWAKLNALVEGLLLRKSLNIKHLEIEGDSAIIINALRKGSLSNWRLDAKLAKDLELYKFKINKKRKNNFF